MISLLGSLLGFGTSFLPKVMDFFQDRAYKAHELKVMSLQIEQAERIAQIKLEQINVEADVREIESLHKSMQPTGVPFIDGLRGSVRPVITYVFMGLFIFVEVSAYLSLTAAGVSSLDAVDAVWTDEVMGLFAAIISFWFGGRALNRKK